MKDRFDLEQQILDCWNITGDIKHITEYLLDAPLEPDRVDKISNMLIGVEELYNIEFQKLFETFEQLISDKKNCKRSQPSYLFPKDHLSLDHPTRLNFRLQ